MDKRFDINLCEAINRIEGYYEYGGDCFFDRLYPFTTENIAGYINYFSLNNKSLLTVGSSGDQVINAVLCGCKDITLVDINHFVKYYYYLKVSSIITLNYHEYMMFLRYRDYPEFCKDNKDVFSIEMYNKIRPILRLMDYESYLFWDELFNTYKGINVRKSLFYKDENDCYTIGNCNLYLLNEDIYNKTKNKIKKVYPKFIDGNLFDVEFINKYDNIWLSNIACYLSLEEVKIMIEKMVLYLNDGGSLMLSYLYNLDKDTKYNDLWVPIYNLEEIFKVFKDYNLLLYSFRSVSEYKKINEFYKYNKYKKKDSVLVYKKI